MRGCRKLLVAAGVVAINGLITAPSFAGHPHNLETPGRTVVDIARGQTALTSGAGCHKFHENVHFGTPGTFAFELPNNRVRVYKTETAGCP